MGVSILGLENKNDKNANVTVSVDVTKIVRNVSIAGVVVVGIVFGCNTFYKFIKWKNED
jgi:hypothetical protein